MSDLSPLERLRTSYEARQKARTTDVDLTEDGSLVARVGMVDASGARDAMRTLMRLVSDDAGDLSDRDLAGVVASATRGLYSRDPVSKALEPLVGDDGAPLSFVTLAAALGVPEITTGEAAVRLVFTEGDPPAVNSLRLLTAATTIAGWLVGDRDAAPGN